MNVLQSLKKSELTLNDALIFAHLAEEGESTQTEISLDTGLALSVVSVAVGKYLLSRHIKGERDQRGVRRLSLTSIGLRAVSPFLAPNLDADRLELDRKFKKTKERFDLTLVARQLEEEISELVAENALAEDRLDALIDLIYFAVGAVHRLTGGKPYFGEAWKRVHAANMKKELASPKNPSKRGDKTDLVKPEGWTAPDLSDLV